LKISIRAPVLIGSRQGRPNGAALAKSPNEPGD
jgi:hypothetical protein